MSMIVYDKAGQLAKKNKNKKKGRGFDLILSGFNPNQMMNELGYGAVQGAGNLAYKAVKGIVSAFQARGATKNDIKQLVAPLAKAITYGSRQPKFSKAEGGLSIEHIEAVNLQLTGHNYVTVDTYSFAWLKNIANQFEEFQIQMWFTWAPICPATTTGQVMMAFDYDPADPSTTYTDATDYFNTIDHCVNAIWAPGMISPKKSAWLKTGNIGDSRLYSPGTFHINASDNSAGYLTVKYQVALRKPQPSFPDSEATFFGSYTTTTGVFASPSFIGGNSKLIQSVTNDTLTIAPTSGYKIVIWSTDGTVASVAPGHTNAINLGTRTGSGAIFVARVAPNVTGLIGCTVTLPGGATSYKVSVFQEDINPIYF